MKHYDIVVIGTNATHTTFDSHLKENCRILFVDEHILPQNEPFLYQTPNIDIAFSTYYRNVIKNENGYTVILNDKRKNIQVSTDMLIKLT